MSKGVSGAADGDGDGWTDLEGDCNDADPNINPAAMETCDGIDNDCGGGLDDSAECPRVCRAPGELASALRVSENGIGSNAVLLWGGAELGLVWIDNGPNPLFTQEQYVRLHTFTEDAESLGVVTIAGPANPKNGDSYGSLAGVWNGSEYGVLFSRRAGFGATGRLEFARIDQGGNLLSGPTGLTPFGRMDDPALIWTGTQYAATWVNLEEEVSGAYLAVINEDGTSFESVVRLMDAGSTTSTVWDGEGLGIGWANVDEGMVRPTFTRFNLQGLGLSEFSPPSEEGGAIVATWDGTAHWLIWKARDGSGDYRYSLLSRDGAVLKGPADLLPGYGAQRTIQHLAATGRGLGVLFGEISNFRLLQFSNQGSVLSNRYPMVPEDPGAGAGRLVWTGREFVAVYAAQDPDDESPVPTVHPWLARVGCHCIDSDADGFFAEPECASTLDCDDDEASVFPKAEQLCDGLNNDCSDPAWPDVSPDELDLDQDGVPVCAGDCADGLPTVYPGAAQLCDGVNNDCADPEWPLLGDEEVDTDKDGVTPCAGDCDDANFGVYPRAEQVCDGVNNDCEDATWPAVPEEELDRDGDGYPVCDGDCDDQARDAHPNAVETCNHRDDDCNGLIDDDGKTEDGDADGAPHACDNCSATFNPDQADGDLDAVGDACDNCPGEYNPTQSDIDTDQWGDRCDLDDGVVYLTWSSVIELTGQSESGFKKWNVYRGDLEVLKQSGQYTQEPGTTPLAARLCQQKQPLWADATVPQSGRVAYYLMTGVTSLGEEGSLGVDGSGVVRANDNACP